MSRAFGLLNAACATVARARGSAASMLLLGALLVIASSAGAASPAAAASCTDAAYRAFDFWLGDWDVFEGAGRKPVARVGVTRILGGCVVQEEYSDTTGHRGRSFSIYDASRGVWHQTWVTNRGELLVIEGEFHDGVMELSGADRTADGKERRVRGTWQAVDGGVREVAARSTDGGQSWAPWFDLLFKAHPR
jgi:hypothetical protein